MCRYFDKRVTRQCREDGADEVLEKDRLNFCDWFKPSDSAFDVDIKNAEDDARSAAEDLFK